MGSFFINLLNGLISDIALLATWVVEFLPASPFVYLSNSPISQYLPTLNWFIPVEAMISALTLWLTAITIYYLVSIVLRWIKAIE